ncbi:MAG: DUF86 domain-containing protein [Thermoplasmata archaeon]
MYKRNRELLVRDIIEAIEKIESYIKNYSYEEFLDDMKTKDAVVRNLEIIGESANLLPDEIRCKYPEIPWGKIIALRNRLIHGYFVVDYRIVWEIVTNELPKLKLQINKILEEER